MPEWWESGDDVLRIARELVRNDTLDTPHLVVDYFEKPWKWTKEREHVLLHDKLARELRAHFGVRAHEYLIDDRVREACTSCTPPPDLEDG